MAASSKNDFTVRAASKCRGRGQNHKDYFGTTDDGGHPDRNVRGPRKANAVRLHSRTFSNPRAHRQRSSSLKYAPEHAFQQRTYTIQDSTFSSTAHQHTKTTSLKTDNGDEAHRVLRHHHRRSSRRPHSHAAVQRHRAQDGGELPCVLTVMISCTGYMC